MLLKLKTLFAICLTAVGTQAAAGALEEVTDYGPNPTGVKMYVYKPEKLANPPPLIVGIHWCHGSAEAYYNGTLFANLADTHGFIVIYPDAPDQVDHCWDVNTNATLTHNGGGDSLGIASQVRYAIKHYGVDRKRIFATGVSSGAMMTNVVCGSYPDLFKAGSASSGVPFGCFAGPDAWNTECATGEVIKTPQQWVCNIQFFSPFVFELTGCSNINKGNLVRDAYPGYRGPRPKFQFWHGTK